jgi:CRP-like cAMP-binding protein
MTSFEPTAARQDCDRATERDWAHVLAGLPLFSGLGKRELCRLARQAQLDEFSPGEAIFRTGALADAFYVILSGEAKARGNAGAHTLTAGDYFGELALVDGAPRSATVVATDELHVMRLPRRPFLQLVERNGRIAVRIMAELGERVRRLERQPAMSPQLG